MNEMSKKHRFTKTTAFFVSNYLFLMRLIAVNLVIVGMPFTPLIQLVLIIILEILYFCTFVYYYK
jgi:hypothetical protein